MAIQCLRTDMTVGYNPHAESWRSPEQKSDDAAREFARQVFDETLTRLCDRAFEIGHDALYNAFSEIVWNHDSADLERRYVEIRDENPKKPKNFLFVCSGQGCKRPWGICLNATSLCPWWRLTDSRGIARRFSTLKNAELVRLRAEKRISENWPRFLDVLYLRDFYVSPVRIDPEKYWRPGGRHAQSPQYRLQFLLDEVLQGV